jgi:hypothetical protein
VTSLRERLENIACEEHDRGSDYQGSLVKRLEPVGMRMRMKEIGSMEGLLMRMLRYESEERIAVEAVKHL